MHLYIYYLYIYTPTGVYFPEKGQKITSFFFLNSTSCPDTVV